MATISLDRDIQRLQKEIKELKKNSEQSCSERDEKLDSLIQKFNILLDETSDSNDLLLVATRYDDFKKMFISFLHEFEDSYLLDTVNRLKLLTNQINASSLFLKGLDLFDKATHTTNELEKYKLKIRGYRYYEEIANQGWQYLQLEGRYEIIKLAFSEKFVLKQTRKKLKLYFKIVWISVIHGRPKLFGDYIKAVTLFISAITKAYEEDHSQRAFYRNLAEKERRRKELYKECWDIFAEAKSKFPYLEEILKKAMAETIELIEREIYVGNYCAMTPFGWIACNYEEVSDYCNQISLRILEEQDLNQPELDLDNLEDF